MATEQYFILMADIISSRKENEQKLMTNFRQLVEELNIENSKSFLSPMTITLGDEFQSIVKSVLDGFNIMLTMEEKIIGQKLRFKLRYVLYQGKIATPVNRKIAYGMLGPGLTGARERLQAIKQSKLRFHTSLKNHSLKASITHVLCCKT